MNILMVVSWYTDQGEDVVTTGIFHYEQAAALKKYANIRMFHPADTSIQEDFTSQEEWGLHTYRSRKAKNPIAARIQFWKAMNRIVKEFRPDVIHTNVALGGSQLVVRYAKMHHIPVIVSEHLPVSLMHLEKPRHLKIAEYVYQNATINTCCSDFLKNELQKQFPDVTYQTVLNGILPITIANAAKSYAIAGKINIVIVAVFYDQFIKGFQFFLPAFKNVLQKNPDVMLHVVGGGTYLQTYQNLAKELNIEDHIIFYGAQNKQTVYEIVKQMDFGVSASLVESAGVSVEEMLLLGKPVLVTNSGGCDSLVSKENAIVVEKGSVEALEEGLTRMIESYPSFDSALIEKYAEERFSMETITKQYLNLYKKAMNRN